jgi:hypothetical protein
MEKRLPSSTLVWTNTKLKGMVPAQRDSSRLLESLLMHGGAAVERKERQELISLPFDSELVHVRRR